MFMSCFIDIWQEGERNPTKKPSFFIFSNHGDANDRNCKCLPLQLRHQSKCFLLSISTEIINLANIYIEFNNKILNKYSTIYSVQGYHFLFNSRFPVLCVSMSKHFVKVSCNMILLHLRLFSFRVIPIFLQTTMSKCLCCLCTLFGHIFLSDYVMIKPD